MSLLCAAIAVALAITATAIAGGGNSIATAPTLPSGQDQVNALNAIDFWRVPLKAGDQLTLRYGGQLNSSWVEVCLFQPAVTDATVGNQPCYAKQTAYGAAGDGVLTISARSAGSWTIAVVPYPGCESGGILDLRCRVGLQYHLTAYVKHPTHVAVTAPNLVRIGTWFTIRGRLSGVRGRVLLELSRDAGAHWTTLAIKATSGTGAFVHRMRVRSSTSLLIRASYPEAPNYVGSAATTAVRVA